MRTGPERVHTNKTQAIICGSRGIGSEKSCTAPRQLFFPPPSAGTPSLGNKRGNNCLRSPRAACKVCLPSAARNDDGNSGASCTRALCPGYLFKHKDNTLVFAGVRRSTRSPSGERYPSDVDLFVCCAAHSGVWRCAH